MHYQRFKLNLIRCALNALYELGLTTEKERLPSYKGYYLALKYASEKSHHILCV